MKESMELRSYQQACIDTCVREYVQNGVRRQAVELPVGSGKTVIFAHLLRHIPPPSAEATKTLVLAHRQELIDQAVRKLHHITGLAVDVDQGDRICSMHADVIVASVPALGRKNSTRIGRYDPSKFKCIIIDEAHHSVAATYENILHYFGVLEPDSKIFLWGCSATLRREDELNLGMVFEKITFVERLRNLMDQKWLSSVRAFRLLTGIDISRVRITKTKEGWRDFEAGDLARALNVDKRNELIVETWKELAAQHSVKATLVFGIDIAHVGELEQAFRRHGVDAFAVTSLTPNDDRNDIVRKFREGTIPVVINCGIFTEGTDIPNIDCVVLARPTASSVLYQQMLGRGLRTHPKKEYCVTLDIVDNHKRNTLVTAPVLCGLTWENASEEETKEMLEERQAEEKEGRRPRLTEEEKEQKAREDFRKKSLEEFDLFEEHLKKSGGNSPNAWVYVNETTYALSIPKTSMIIVSKDAETGRFKAFSRLPGGKPLFLPIDSDSLSGAIRAVDTYLMKENVANARTVSSLGRQAKWRSLPPTDTQLQFLNTRYFPKKAKIVLTRENCGDYKISRGTATDIITRMAARNQVNRDGTPRFLFWTMNRNRSQKST